jgi:uridylate kinase
MSTPYKRILLKLSGEALAGPGRSGLDPHSTHTLCKAIKSLHDVGTEIGIVIGGGNIFRGINAQELGLPRTPADQMGMLATLINGITLQNSLNAIGCHSKLMSALECPRVAEAYSWSRALEYLAHGEIVIFVGGTGNPYFTTDTAAALRASEIHAQALLKATKVDGVYDKDPKKYPDAKKYDRLSYEQYLAEKLEVMDATSIALCMSNKIPILVFNMNKLVDGKATEILTQRNGGTLITTG